MASPIETIRDRAGIILHANVIFKDLFNIHQNITDKPKCLNHAMNWLKQAQDVNSDGGVSAGYSLMKGWLPSYPETTGYIIPTFINYYHLSNEEEYLSRAIKMADWLISIQYPNGSIKGLFGSTDAKPAIFNTGQVLQGLIRTYNETQNENYLEAAIKAANWLVEKQDEDGSWRKFNYSNVPHVYDTRVSWPLLEIYEATSEEKYRNAAVTNIKWALSNQETNGWFRDNAFDLRSYPLLHNIAYAIEGLIESAVITANDSWLDAAMKPADVLLREFEIRGSLSGTYNEEWKGMTKHRCLTGEAQISLCWLRLFLLAKDSRFLNAALRINNNLKKLLDTTSKNRGINGGVKGAHPIWGSYQSFTYPNWAVKFFADSLMLEIAGLSFAEQIARESKKVTTEIKSHRTINKKYFLSSKLKRLNERFSVLFHHLFAKQILKFNFNEFDKVVCEIKLKDSNNFFIGPRSPEIFCEYANENKTGTAQTLNDAKMICQHTFDLLGSGETFLGEKIAWNLDWKSGERWENRWYFDLLYTLNTTNNSDRKIPYELSRFQHLPVLGKAYWLTGDEKYTKEFIAEIDDWIDNNPPLHGINWTCTMDVAIRAVNWIWGYYFIKDSREIGDQFLTKFLQNLYIHGRFIFSNLDHSSRLGIFARSLIKRHPNLNIFKPGWHEPVSNHYLSDIVGLVYLGVIFPEIKEGKKWLKFGIQELIREMRAEVYPDGVDYEGSISYHRLATELFLSATLLCLKNDIGFPDWYMKWLENMIDFIMYYTKPDGTAPQFGDNDDGRLHILANYGNWNRRDHRYLLSIGAILFNRADFKRAAGEFHEEAFWLLGREGQIKFNQLPDEKHSISTKAFMQGGIYILRKEDLYMAVDCISADPKAPSGHQHNSQLSFELYAHDKSFIIDPGAYIYTADKEMRNLFRGTKNHNTIVVDGEEQNQFDKNELFDMSRSVVKLNKWKLAEEDDILEVEHYGYKRLSYPVIHRRRIFFSRTGGYWAIKDILSGEGVHHFDLYFHLAPMEIEVSREFPFVVITKTKGANLAIIPMETEGLNLELANGYISYQYGVKSDAPVVKYSKRGCVPVTFCNVLYPYIGEINIGEIIWKVKNLKE